VDEKPGVTAGLPPPGRLGVEAPLLVVFGANDRQVSPDACSAWGEAAGADVVAVPGANHFFWAKYEQLSEVVGDWLDRKVEGAA
jgi:alpha/beta superfamily hydrolase